MQKGNTVVGLIIAVVVVLALAGGMYMWRQSNPPPPAAEEPTFCTQDAQLCPDGSYVGRVPPSCEFAACPIVAPSSDFLLE